VRDQVVQVIKQGVLPLPTDVGCECGVALVERGGVHDVAVMPDNTRAAVLKIKYPGGERQMPFEIVSS
jgi:hypothetical protein